jgi:hypothetical protein
LLPELSGRRFFLLFPAFLQLGLATVFFVAIFSFFVTVFVFVFIVLTSIKFFIIFELALRLVGIILGIKHLLSFGWFSDF